MHAAVEELSPAEAVALREDPGQLQAWLTERGLAFDLRLNMDLLARAEEYVPPPPPAPPTNPHRVDGATLRDFVLGEPHLPLRVRQVAGLCILEGLTLDACAARIGIARETVRVHLRRLRALHRRAIRNATAEPGRGFT